MHSGHVGLRHRGETCKTRGLPKGGDPSGARRPVRNNARRNLPNEAKVKVY
jgi:hypothetical protein